jgi:hypothetical protein
MTNPLDELFKHIKKEMHEEGIARSNLPRLPRISQYANPDNWRLGKVVQLIHAEEGAIGVYQEYFHNRSLSARRLLPAHPAAAVDRTELVFGDHWLHPHFQSPLDPDSDAEVRAITSRFNEIMQYEEDWDRKLRSYIQG